MTQLCARRSSSTELSRAEPEPAWYLYAITRVPPGVDAGGLSGLPNGSGKPRPVELITRGSVAALASPVLENRVRPQRSNLVAHHGLLRQLLESGVAFLPAAFGVMAPSRQGLVSLLKANHDALERELRHLDGKVEMGLKVTWDVDNIFSYFVSQHPELARRRDELASKPGGGSRDELIELGQEFEHLLSRAREQHLTTVKQALGSCVEEFKESPPRDEKVVMKVACLVSRSQGKAFEQAVLRAAAAFDDHYAFDYNGPWPTFSFVNVAIRGTLLTASGTEVS